MVAGQGFFLGLNIPLKKIYLFFKILVFLNIFFLIGTWLHAEKMILAGNANAKWFFVELSLAKENVVASWYSSMLIFCGSLCALLCYWADMQRAIDKTSKVLNLGWLIMTGVFVVLSFDEMGSFHETLSETPLLKTAGGGQGKLVFFILIGAVSVFMAFFFFVKFKSDKWALLLNILGLLFLLSNPFQEKFEIESWRSSPDPSQWHRPVLYLLLEEGSEVFAFLCFLVSFALYAINAGSVFNPKGERVLSLSAPVHKRDVLWLAGLSLTLGIAMWLIHANAWNLPDDDNGVPQDWPPSVMSFACFIGSMYLFFKKGFESKRQVYMVVAIASLFLSMYFGSYMYGYGEGPFVKVPYAAGILVGIAGLAAVVKLKGKSAMLFFIGWVAFIWLSIFKKEFASTVYGYAGACCLLLGLFWHYMEQQNINKGSMPVEDNLSKATA